MSFIYYESSSFTVSLFLVWLRVISWIVCCFHVEQLAFLCVFGCVGLFFAVLNTNSHFQVTPSLPPHSPHRTRHINVNFLFLLFSFHNSIFCLSFLCVWMMYVYTTHPNLSPFSIFFLPYDHITYTSNNVLLKVLLLAFRLRKWTSKFPFPSLKNWQV